MTWANCFADQTWQLAPMTISLPDDLKKSVFKEDGKEVFFYLFEAPSAQLKIVVINQSPAKETDNEAWQLDMLGRQIALWQQSAKESLESQRDVLAKKPNTEQIGNYQYQTVNMTFPNQEVKFLNVVKNQATYMFTLVSTDSNLEDRKKNMQILVEQLKSVELK